MGTDGDSVCRHDVASAKSVHALSGLPHARPPTLTQIPQPMHSTSESVAIFDPGLTSIQSLPVGMRGGSGHTHRPAGELEAARGTVSPLTDLDDGTALFALLPAFLRLAPAFDHFSVGNWRGRRARPRI